MIVYDRALSAAELQLVESYLIDKFALDTTGGGLPQVGTPTMSPNGGDFAGSQSIEIGATTRDASVYYTLDGSVPTESNGTLYTGPFSISETTTIKARSFKAGQAPSEVVAVEFTNTDEDFAPSSVPGLIAWMSTTAGVSPTNNMSLWNDLSGNDNYLWLQSSRSAPRVIRDELNGFPVLRFDGVDDMMWFRTRLTTIRSVFWVLKEHPDAAGVARSMMEDSVYAHLRGGSDWIWARSSSSTSVRNGQTWIKRRACGRDARSKAEGAICCFAGHHRQRSSQQPGAIVRRNSSLVG